MVYFKRHIDDVLLKWKDEPRRKPLLLLAGLIIPVVHSDGNGVSIGAEANDRFVKYLFVDIGLLRNMLQIPSADILLVSDTELVNKGSVSEMFAGLEMIKYSHCYQRPELYYWQNMSKNANAEVDYLCTRDSHVLPVEVKASTRGSMQSLYLFMRKKHLAEAVRTSLENFGHFDYIDSESNNETRTIHVIPLYVLSNMKE